MTVATPPRTASTVRPDRPRTWARTRFPTGTAMAWPTVAQRKTRNTSTRTRITSLLVTHSTLARIDGSSHIPRAPPPRNPTRETVLTTIPWR